MTEDQMEKLQEHLEDRGETDLASSLKYLVRKGVVIADDFLFLEEDEEIDLDERIDNMSGTDLVSTLTLLAGKIPEVYEYFIDEDDEDYED